MLIEAPITTGGPQTRPDNRMQLPKAASAAARWFLLTGLVSLVAGMFFGSLGGIQYLLPDFLQEYLPFSKARPLHVTLVLSWIFQGAVGGIYQYLPRALGKALYSDRMARWHWYLFMGTGAAILIAYFTGTFGGREYLEYPAWLSLPVILSWSLLIINYFKTLSGNWREYPIYLWMWGTGVIAFMVTYLESYMWLLPGVRENTIRDITLQWKANGAMVGAWNQLVYGTAFYLMERISGDMKVTRSRTTFFFYFLGLTNLMFNWGHHTYIIPASSWIRHVAYIISMTELLILGSIIWNWKKTVSQARKNFHLVPFRLIAASDFWIFLNLVLALLISVPAINFYTHGTHITVAHAMGATIGINTLILIASAYAWVFDRAELTPAEDRMFRWAFWLTNLFLFIFWVSMLGSGVLKSMSAGHPFGIDDYAGYLEKTTGWFRLFTLSGIALFVCICLLTIPLFRRLFADRPDSH
jgi:nitric oxide reductase subunit B